jgi:L-lactate dehydrogenase complex protein LldG
MSSSRESILSSVHRNRPAPAELPAIEHVWTTFTDPLAKFVEVLELVGGQALIARDAENLNEQLSRLPQFSSAQKIASFSPAIGRANVDLSAITAPHDLADIDVAIMRGDFAVAENAAVWVTDEHVPLRVLYFLCQHLVLVVPADQIVDHMHAAYDRLAIADGGDSVFSSPRFGTFISGPSKTADIEQSLVIGAHGPRSLTVCFLEN